MGRPCLDRNPKFSKLARKIGSRPLARGHLELMWDAAHECGRPMFRDADEVEAACDWAGESGVLCGLLVECRLLDQYGTHFEIHDYWDHAPEYARDRREREQERQSKGLTLRGLRADAGRRGGIAKASKCLATAGNLPEEPGKCLANDRTPAPAPAPSIKRSPAQPSVERAALESNHQEFYQAYRRKKNPTDSLKAYKSARKSGTPHSAIMDGLALYQDESAAWPIDKIKYPASWLRAGGFSSVADSDADDEEEDPDVVDNRRMMERAAERQAEQ